MVFTAFETEENPLTEIETLLRESSPEQAFVGWVEERRNRNLLRNDDVTMMIVDIDFESTS